MKGKYKKYISLGFDYSGKRVRKWIYGNSERELQLNVKRALMDFNPDIIITQNVTVRSYSRRWLEAYKSRREVTTQEYYRTGINKLNDAIGYMRITDVKQIDLQKLITDNWDHPRTCKKLKQILGQIFTSAQADGIITRNPAANLELPQYRKAERRILTDAERKAVLSAELPEQERLFLDIEYYLGLRPEEARALMRNDFDLKEGTVTIDKAVTFDVNRPVLKGTKNGKVRTIPLPDVLCAEIRSYFASNSCFYIFTDKDNHLMTKTQFRAFSERIFNALNRASKGSSEINAISGLTFYTFRHTRGTDLYYLTQAKDGLSTKMAAYYMGHSEQMFLSCYSHIDRKKENVERLKEVVNLE